ncbi:MAG: hypothetical protein ACOC1U_06710, partial [Spirochaetota bacterium]
MRRMLAGLLALLVTVALAADRLELANGDVITGTITSMDAERVVIRSDYGVLEIPRSSIVRGTFGDDARRVGALGATEPGTTVDRPEAQALGEAAADAADAAEGAPGEADAPVEAEAGNAPALPILRFPFDGNLR